MQNTTARETQAHRPKVRCAHAKEERLLRLRATRRDRPRAQAAGSVVRVREVELRVHYEIRRENGCDVYKIITIDEVD